MLMPQTLVAGDLPIQEYMGSENTVNHNDLKPQFRTRPE